MLTEQQARKYKKSASFHHRILITDNFHFDPKEDWKRAKQIRKHYSKYINQIKSKGKHK